MVHRAAGVDGHVWCEELNAWLAPDVVRWIAEGAPVTIEIGDVGYLFRHGEPTIRYNVEPTSPTKH